MRVVALDAVDDSMLTLEQFFIFNAEEGERYPYSRLDLALMYRHTFRSFHFEAGISILNVLNTENLKYSNLVRIPSDQTSSVNIDAEAIPFTPTIYLNILL